MCYVTVVSPVVWADIKAKTQELDRTAEEYQRSLRADHQVTSQYQVKIQLLYCQPNSDKPCVAARCLLLYTLRPVFNGRNFQEQTFF